MIIGLSGYARSGKDSIADVLVAERGFQRAAFAAVMKSMALAIDPYVLTDGEFWKTITEDEFLALDEAPNEHVRLAYIVEVVGWEKAKAIPDVRRYLQRLGTEGGRNHLGDNIWVDALMHTLDDQHDWVVTDVRFPNEAQAIAEFGGELWRVTRNGVNAANAHPSETMLDAWKFFDRHIDNGGTLDDLRCTVLEVVLTER